MIERSSRAREAERSEAERRENCTPNPTKYTPNPTKDSLLGKRLVPYQTCTQSVCIPRKRPLIQNSNLYTVHGTRYTVHGTLQTIRSRIEKRNTSARYTASPPSNTEQICVRHEIKRYVIHQHIKQQAASHQVGKLHTSHDPVDIFFIRTHIHLSH